MKVYEIIEAIYQKLIDKLDAMETSPSCSFFGEALQNGITFNCETKVNREIGYTEYEPHFTDYKVTSIEVELTLKLYCGGNPMPGREKLITKILTQKLKLKYEN